MLEFNFYFISDFLKLYNDLPDDRFCGPKIRISDRMVKLLIYLTINMK